MKIGQDIATKLALLMQNYQKSAMSELDLVEELRKEANGSSFLFSFLLEQLLIIAYDQKKLIPSKYLLKLYLKSKIKEYPDFVFYGGSDTADEVFHAANNVKIQKGAFLKIAEKLNLKKTLNAYIKHIICIDTDLNPSEYLSKKDLETYKTLDEVVELLYKEMDELWKNPKKVISFKT